MPLSDVNLGDADGRTRRTPSTGSPAKAPAKAAPKPPAGSLVPVTQVSDLEEVRVTDLRSPESPGEATDLGQNAALYRVLFLLRYAAAQVTDAARRTGSYKGGLGDARQESWNQYRARVNARAWLPEGYDGKFLIVVPTGFYYSVGLIGWAFDGLGWLFKHMLAFITAFLLVAAVIALWFCFG